MSPARLNLRSMERRVAGLAKFADAERARARGEELRAASIRIFMDPEALEASIAMFDWVCEKLGVDEEGYVYRPDEQWDIGKWIGDDPAAQAQVERWVSAIERARKGGHG